MGDRVERQVSFAAGEVSPSLHGRTDLQMYRAGCKTLRDMLVNTSGEAKTRTGTQHVVTLPEDITEPVVHPFAYDTDKSGVLVFQFPSEDSLLAAVRLFSFTGSDWKYSPTESSNDSSILLNSGSDLHKLRLLSLGSSVVVLTDDYYYGNAVKSLAFDVSATPPSFLSGKILRNASPPVSPSSLPVRPSFRANATLFVATPGNVPGSWLWLLSYVIEKDDEAIQTDAYVVDRINVKDTNVQSVFNLPDKDRWDGSGYAISFSSSSPAEVDVGITAGDSLLGGTVLETRVYRAPFYPLNSGYSVSNGPDGALITPLPGYVGRTKTRFFVDRGALPEFNNPPPLGRNPFISEAPRYGAYWEGRRYLVKASSARIHGSAVEDFENFDKAIPSAITGEQDASDAVEFLLSGQRQQTVRALVPAGGKFWCLTNSSEWVISGSGEQEIVRPGSVAAREVSYHGSADIEPAVAGRFIFFVDRGGARVWALDSSNGETTDVTAHARHLFEGYSIVEIAWQQRPDPMLWVVRSDGALLSMSFLPSFNVRAWALHTIGVSGQVRSVAVVPEGEEDGVYLIVGYDGSYQLERMARRLCVDVADQIHLDRCVTYDGEQGSDITFDNTGLTEDRQIKVIFDSPPSGISVGSVIRVPVTGDSAGDALLRLVVDEGSDEYLCSVLNRSLPSELESGTKSSWVLCTQSVNGLGHLEGKTVVAVGDGNVIRTQGGNPLVVSGGTAQVASDPFYYGKIHVGVEFTPELQTLRAPSSWVEKKKTTRVTIELSSSRGGKVGSSLDGAMYDLPGRRVSDGYDTLQPTTDVVEVPVSGGYDRNGFAAFQQNEPLAATVRGITWEYSEGGRP